ncbi:MAG TPA: Gfo/Idh/MocA family oxidoreductase [Xanthobacteraceae bacterium]|nr:Gfo/Idh/MocA family oxidoreductase [Xanthobacteraceae bacterium]
MTTRTVGIILNGATGRICSTQHLQNALAPICAEGGIALGEDRIVPQLLLVGRNREKLAAIARQHNVSAWTTDLDQALANPDFSIVFDAAATHARLDVLHKAIAAGKHIYTEKPVAPSAAEGLALLKAAEARGLKHGAVEDKLYLPGLQKLAYLMDIGFFGRVVNFKLEFGWWVFDGRHTPAQRPSWNYKSSGGGGLTFDMYPHWRYVIEGLLGRIRRIVSAAWTAQPERIDERGEAYQVDVDDSVSTIVELENGAFGTILSSWATRVRRDDLLMLHVDGTHGSAVAGLHRCHIQSLGETPKIAGFSVAVDLGMDYRTQWGAVPDLGPYKNPYRVGWEGFLRHVVADEPFAADLRAGLRDVALAEACRRSMAERRWVDLA